MRFPIGHIRSRRWAWVVLALAISLFAALMAWGSGITNESSAPATLPPDSESYQVREAGADFPGGEALTAIVVFSRSDGQALALADLAAAEQAVSAMAATELPQAARQQLGAADSAEIAQASPLIPLAEELAQAVLTIPGAINGSGLSETVSALRQSGRAELDDALVLQLTGPAGFSADTAAAFDGANFALLGISALVVAVLLMLTYRSPILWLIPLLVVFLADRMAAMLLTVIAAYTPLVFDASTAGIMSVLVFGASTNYALLLISRYREELRRNTDARHALGVALRASFAAIVSSNVTVVLSLLALLAALVPAYASLGVSLALGLLIALACALFVLPAALSLCGRGLFWPRIPQANKGDHAEARAHSHAAATPVSDEVESGPWYRVAHAVSQRPWTFLAAMVVVLLALASGLFGAKVGLATTEQFRTDSEAADGVATISRFVSPGAASPLTVIAPAGSEAQVTAAIERLEELQIQGPPQRSVSGDSISVTVIADAAPATAESYEQIRQLREELHRISPEAKVGGLSAETLDTRTATARDTTVVMPMILGIILVLLIIILRALVAPLLLLAATTLSALAALGAGALVSQYVFGFPALDVSVPLYSLIFLVALGIDYTVFLVLRVKEEATDYGTRHGMTRAVSLTGGVITSAGIVLAAVFAVLGVLPLITLGQIGIVVGLGIVIDTFLVRTLVVPALFAILGAKMWWPNRPAESSAAQPGAQSASELAAPQTAG